MGSGWQMKPVFLCGNFSHIADFGCAPKQSLRIGFPAVALTAQHFSII